MQMRRLFFVGLILQDLSGLEIALHRTACKMVARNESDRIPGAMAMNVLISGASGMVGTALAAALTAQNHTITRLTRGKPKPGEVFWDPSAGTLDPASLAGVDAVVHLAGENIAGRWTTSKKKAIVDSRVKGTRTLCDAVLKMSVPPKVFVSASAIGFYGNRGDEVLSEASVAGPGFLPDVCKAWEAASEHISKAGIRRVLLRIGVVLSTKGGALKQMLTPFKMGVGGVVGSGKQYMSWITLEDVVGIIAYALKNDGVKGPINAVAPNAATNREFTKALGTALSRPTIFPLPGFVVQLLFGEMGVDLLLGSTRVKPERLAQAGFTFQHPTLDEALKSTLAPVK